ncbi:MAG: hypothetical protein LQ338_006515 [Usnochroma carphineum]|nr:MAG: hypothetical protein LQ338_006515 [Usnochroma carphineum]
MTPSYSQDPLDSQNKPATYFPSRQHAQLYQNMLAQSQQKPFAPQPYSLPPLDMGSDDLINGLGALNQQAIHNLAAPLTYPDPEPSMSVRNTSVADLQPANFATSARSATSINTPSNYHQQQENRPSSQSAGTQTSTASPTAAASTPAKKKFPCPHAAKFDCADTFTTSGHASRHGKKHTGEKSVICPTCSKAFTRKDNMKQHERTHKDGKSSATSSPISTSAQHAHKTSEGSASKAQVNGRVKATSARSEEEDGEGESPGLDALAMAANME